jgi:predicted aminopeptidase
MRGRWVAQVIGLVLCLPLLNGCSVGFLWHVTVGQVKLLMSRQPVQAVLQDPHLSEQDERKIRLILDAKAFAIEHLGLHNSKSYTTFVRLDRPYVSYNVTAAPKDALRPYTWRFPIVGRVPYKGYFCKEYALREQHKLEAEGYDTYVRGVRAYSMLGYFDDPILSSMLHARDFSLINTTIHEMVHQTVWIKGNASFNESLASFIGEKGTHAYLAWRYGDDSSQVQLYQNMRADAAVFAEYLEALIEHLEVLYRQPMPRQEKLRRRAQIFAEAKTAYANVFPRMKTPYYKRFFEYHPLNNAVLLSFRRYHRDTSYFEQVLAAHGGDLRRMIAFFKTVRADQLPATFRKQEASVRRENAAVVSRQQADTGRLPWRISER